MLRLHVPLIEPDVRISRIRLSDKASCVRTRKIGTLTIIDRDTNSNDLIDDPGALVATYSYAPASPQGLRRADSQHRRIRKYTAPSGDNWTVQEYYYNESWQVLEVRKATKTRTGGAEPALADTLHKQYIWGADYIDSPVVRFRDSSATPDGVLDETLYYTHDAQFNVTALVTPGGAVAERYAYDPYGKVTVLNGANGTDKDGTVTEWEADSVNASDWDNQILYCGYRWDPESGLYHVRYRPYHPTLGRWISRDPIRYGDGMNLYQYVRSAPCVATDWSGRESVVMNLLGGITDRAQELVRGLGDITVDDFRIGFESITVDRWYSFAYLGDDLIAPTGVMVVEINRKGEACPCGPDKEVGRRPSVKWDRTTAVHTGTIQQVRAFNRVTEPPEWYEINPSLSITVYSPYVLEEFYIWTGSVDWVEEETVDCEGPDGPYSETIFRARTQYAGTFLGYACDITVDATTYGSTLLGAVPLATIVIGR